MKRLTPFFFLLPLFTGLLSCDSDSGTSTPPPQTPTLVLWDEDDFSKASSMDGFETNSDPWLQSNGAISCRGRTGQSYLIRNDAWFKNGWVEADIDTIDDGGISMRVKDASNMIQLALHDNSAPYNRRLASRIQLWIVSNGNYTVIDSSAFNWPRGTKVTARLQVVNDTIEVWVNGTRLCRKINATIRDSGSVALRHLGTTNDPQYTNGTMISHYLAMRWQEL